MGNAGATELKDRWIVGDFNGEGKHDLVYMNPWDGGSYMFLSDPNNPLPDLLTRSLQWPWRNNNHHLRTFVAVHECAVTVSRPDHRDDYDVRQLEQHDFGLQCWNCAHNGPHLQRWVSPYRRAGVPGFNYVKVTGPVGPTQASSSFPRHGFIKAMTWPWGRTTRTSRMATRRACLSDKGD